MCGTGTDATQEWFEITNTGSEPLDFVARSLRRLTPPDPGPGQMRRLSSLEYANTLRDLFGVEPTIDPNPPQG